MGISETFERLKRKNEMAYMPYLCLGDPDRQTSIKMAKELCKSADLIELGLPFSDPIADGPVLHAAATRALKAGMTTGKAFECIKEIRSSTRIPIVVMTYCNIALNPSIGAFIENLASSGADGLILPDLPIEEAEEMKKSAREHGIALIFMATSSTKQARLEKILDATEGCLYLTATEGTTGARERLDGRISDTLKRIRAISGIPVAVGFGISSKEQAIALKSAGADGVIIGSRIAELYTQESGKDAALERLHKLSLGIKSGCI